MQRLFDELVSEVWAIEVAGVDVIDAGIDCLAQNGERFGRVFGWTPDVRTGKLHGSIAHAVEIGGGLRKREATAESVG